VKHIAWAAQQGGLRSHHLPTLIGTVIVALSGWAYHLLLPMLQRAASA